MLPSGGSNPFVKQKLYEHSSTTAKNNQDFFWKNLAEVLNDSTANELQCSTSSNKPCECIRKFILSGSNWKTAATLNPEKSHLFGNDQIKFTLIQLDRAKELLDIFYHASELKKEKCYGENNAIEGKSVKELRGAIGLGNGRKRSKRYEDYVLITRKKLRENYCLCEKAAKKLLGYSINFLYKKLRTNPEKKSRIVATNKTGHTPRNSKQVIPVDQLKEKAISGQNQCCTRFCIRNLVTNNYEKMVDWRKRLDGCTQRVAQEIIAEVLQTAESMDGPKSFCQNVVHWVTGCSFKKIRRVRDHLKKDPKSLPVHGLKDYYRKKVQEQANPENKNDSFKEEKILNSVFETNQNMFSTPRELSTIKIQNNLSSNHNNNNNRVGSQLECPVQSFQSFPNQYISFPVGPDTIPSVSSYQQQPYISTSYTAFTQSESNIFMSAGANTLSQNFDESAVSVDASTVIPNSNSLSVAYQEALETVNNSSGGQVNLQNLNTTQTVQIPPISLYSDVQHNRQVNNALVQPGEALYPCSESASVEYGIEPIQPYIVAASNESFQENVYQSGLTPYLLAQPSDAGQPIFLFSPTLNTNQNEKDIDSWSQMIPVTPIQMHPGSSVLGNSQIPSSVTPVAIMQAQGNVISGWVSTQHVVASNQMPLAASENVQNITNVAPVSTEQNFLQDKPTPANLFSEKENEVTCQHTSKPDDKSFVKPNFVPINLVQSDNDTVKTLDQDVKLPGGIDHNKQFSRDRLGAIIDSPFMVPVFTPSLVGNVSKDTNTSNSMEIASTSMLSQINSKSIFTFPPAGHSWMAAMQMSGPSKNDLKRKTDKKNASEKISSESSESHGKNKPASNDQDQVSALCKRHDGSLGSCSSIGNIPENLMQNELLIKGLSSMSSLPVLNLPSAGWANDSTQSFSSQQLSTQPTQTTNSLSNYSTEVDSFVTVFSSASFDSEASEQPLIQVPVKKKRKVVNTDIGSTKPKTTQKQIRFHNFTPSDFANGEVNVSQYKKPSEYVSSSTINMSEVRFLKRNRKSTKHVTASQTVSTEASADKAPNKEALNRIDTDYKLSDVSATVAEFDQSFSGLAVSKENTIAKSSTPNVVSMLPLKTPSILKTASPKFKIMVPSTAEVATSLSTPLPLNTPLFVHSGALLTPSNKLNSAFLYRVSPEQLSSQDKTSLATPQFFNFSNTKFPYFFACDGHEQQQKSSESSDSPNDTTDADPINRSHMTLNLSQKTGTDDSLQTPSKIPVVTPSAMLPNIKVTPDMPPAFLFPSEKQFDDTNRDTSADKQPGLLSSLESAQVGGELAPSDGDRVQSETAVFMSLACKKDSEESALPSIVVNAPVSRNDESSVTMVSQSVLNSTDSSLKSLKKEDMDKDNQFVISVDESEQKMLNNPSSLSPLNTPALTQIVTPTIETLSHTSKLNSPGKNILAPRPQSLFVASIGSTSVANSSSQVSTPIFYQLVSPSQGTAPSPSFMLLSYPQKNMVSFANGSLLSPAFGIVPRPNSGVSGSSTTSLLKSALINQRAVFQFPPMTRSGAPGMDSLPVKETVLSNDDLKRVASEPEPKSNSKPRDDRCEENQKATAGQDQEVFVASDICLSESAV